jgi:hypothetical protein
VVMLNNARMEGEYAAPLQALEAQLEAVKVPWLDRPRDAEVTSTENSFRKRVTRALLFATGDLTALANQAPNLGQDFFQKFPPLGRDEDNRSAAEKRILNISRELGFVSNRIFGELTSAHILVRQAIENPEWMGVRYALSRESSDGAKDETEVLNAVQGE